MLALSPPLFCTNYGWPLEELIPQNIQQDLHNEANSYHSLLDFPTYDQVLPYDFAPQISISSGEAANGNISDTRKVAKKLDHNASERDRRKRVNNLYTFLRSLLPLSSDQKKKVSIPGIVSQALKYIPDLQKEVNTLKNKKEKLKLCSSSTNFMDRSAKATTNQKTSSVVASVSVLNDKAAVIQLIFSSHYLKKNKGIGLLSTVVEYLEEEEGLVLLNTTTFKCPGKDRCMNTLHFQVQDDHKLETEKLKEKLSSLYT
uniref:transcription factor bHLH100-like n=1 Tax=Erigeron canadensis TaxID=72917 RepID=UPI001CB9928F|nr:transcription factor bHLH100-like [Erigeron canadensis]